MLPVYILNSQTFFSGGSISVAIGSINFGLGSNAPVTFTNGSATKSWSDGTANTSGSGN
jgi:hypothetical protein